MGVGGADRGLWKLVGIMSMERAAALQEVSRSGGVAGQRKPDCQKE